MSPTPLRIALSGLALSAAGFGAIATYEDWSPVALPPVKGDVPTYGFGSTTDASGAPLKGGEKITPTQGVVLALRDISKFEGAVKQCVQVPLAQYEYDAYLSLAYNIGPANFCGSTLVKKLNAQDYTGACMEILRWNRFKGQPMRGLTLRRQGENKKCLGERGAA